MIFTKTIQNNSCNYCYYYLRAIGVWSSVGHRQVVWCLVFQFEVLVSEFLAVDRLAASTVAARKVTALAHELRDDAVERRSFVVQRFARFTGTY